MPGVLGGLLLGLDDRLGGPQQHPHRAALARRRLQLQLSPQARRGAHDRRQAQSGARSLTLGGVEGLQDPLLEVCGDADAGVADLEEDAVDVGTGTQRQRAAGRHGVDRVADEVVEHQLEGVGVGVRVGGEGIEVEHDAHGGAGQSLEEHRASPEEAHERHRLGSQWLLSSLGEQLAGQSLPLLGGGEDLLDQLLRLLLEQRLGARADDREQVVDVVGDAAGEVRDHAVLGGRLDLPLHAPTLAGVHQRATQRADGEVVRGQVVVGTGANGIGTVALVDGAGEHDQRGVGLEAPPAPSPAPRPASDRRPRRPQPACWSPAARCAAPARSRTPASRPARCSSRGRASGRDLHVGDEREGRSSQHQDSTHKTSWSGCCPMGPGGATHPPQGGWAVT